jgi:hypothetical protein
VSARLAMEHVMDGRSGDIDLARSIPSAGSQYADEETVSECIL